MEVINGSMSENGNFVIDARFLPYNVPDSDRKYWSKQTKKHLTDRWTPTVLDWHGVAFGGSADEVGRVLESWETDDGYWASIELYKDHPEYSNYINASKENKLFVSAGGIPSYYKKAPDGMITDWATAEISLVNANKGHSPKSWYAISKESEKRVINSIMSNSPSTPATDEKVSVSVLERILSALGGGKSHEQVLNSLDDKKPCDCSEKEKETLNCTEELAKKNKAIEDLNASLNSVKDEATKAHSELEVINSKLNEAKQAHDSEIQKAKAENERLAELLNSETEALKDKIDAAFLDGLGDKVMPSEREAKLKILKAARSNGEMLNSDAYAEAKRNMVGINAKKVGDDTVFVL